MAGRAVDPARLIYTLDILTDGSERTGHGAIFLSVRKAPVCTHASATNNAFTDDESYFASAVDDSDPSHVIVARYALSGLPTLTARLASDQKLRLAPVRATFLPDLRCNSIAGIPSLLLALRNAGTEKTFVAGPGGSDAYVQSMVDLVLGSRNRIFPHITTCELPSAQSPSDVAHGNAWAYWWKVYEDEYLLVHGRHIGKESVHRNSSSSLSELSPVAYIFTIKHVVHQSKNSRSASKTSSFLVLPPFLNVSSPTISRSLLPFPEIVERSSPTENGSKQHLPFAFLVFLAPRSTHFANETFSKLAPHLLGTLPNRDGANGWDAGLLVRASYQLYKLHQHLPFAFPVGRVNTSRDNHTVKRNVLPPLFDASDFTQMRSCTSIILFSNRRADRDYTSAESGFRIVDRGDRIWKRCRKNGEDEVLPGGNNDGSEMDFKRHIAELATLYLAENSQAIAVIDKNEIDLGGQDDEVEMADDNEIELSDEEDDSDNIDGRCLSPPSIGPINDLCRPQIIVLGSGCASPSPTRGSSGYALLLPTFQNEGIQPSLQQDFTLAVIIECGEGTLTSLQRSLPPISDPSNHLSSLDLRLRQVKFIWISHGHLDHYGEVSLVVQAIAEAGGRQNDCTCRGNNGQRDKRNPALSPNGCTCPLPPIVIAPSKVLRFLDASLGATHGVVKTSLLKGRTRKRNLDQVQSVDDNASNIPQRLYFGVSNRDFDLSPFAVHHREMLFNSSISPSSSFSSDQSNRISLEFSCYKPFISMRNIPVDHCPQAHALLLGLIVRGKPYYLCYSGDTRPSPTLVRVCQELWSREGKTVSLLIHESTFDDDERGRLEALAKSHSTIMEAYNMAKQINAKQLLLTHFSQRYPILHESAAGLSTITDDGRKLSVCSALDGMSIPLLAAPKVLPLLNYVSKHILNGSIDKSRKLRESKV